MSAAKTLVPELRFPGFDENWQSKPLANVLREHKRKNKKNDCEVFSVSQEKGLVNQIEHLGRSFSAKDTSNYNKAGPHDIVYTKSPLRDYPYGIVKQSKLDTDVAVSPLYGVFAPKNRYLGTIIEAHFESPYRSKSFIGPLAQKGAKNTINITNATFLSGHMTLPESSAEQQKIADCLGSLDDLLAAHSRKLAALQDHKKGLLQQLFPTEGETTPKLRFPVFRSEWGESCLKDLCDVITKGATPTSYGFGYVEDGVRFIKIESLDQGRIKHAKTSFITDECHNYLNRSKLEDADLLFSIAGGLGEPAIVDKDDLPANTNQALGIIRLKRRKNAPFILAALRSEKVQQEIIRIKAGAAQPNLWRMPTSKE
jgi:type I restriction enzyme, S subunit